MGLNYYTLIGTLFTFKNRLIEFRTAKNTVPVAYFQNTILRTDEDNEPILPDLKSIMQATGLPRQKVSSGIKELYQKIIENTYFNPIVVSDVNVTISISIPWDELSKSKNKAFAEEQRQKTLEIHLKLPVIPQIGEYISLNFISKDLSWYSGYVQDVRHEIDRSQQRVILFVHPYENYYYEWARLKADYEWSERLKRKSN